MDEDSVLLLLSLLDIAHCLLCGENIFVGEKKSVFSFGILTIDWVESTFEGEDMHPNSER